MSAMVSLDGASIAVQLAALEEDHHDAEIQSGKSAVTIESKEHVFRREQQILAQEKALEEADDSSFWSDVASIAKDVAVVGAVAGAAFSGGSTLIVAAAIIGGGLTVGGDIAKKLGADEDLCTGLEIAGAAVSLCAGGATLLTSTPALVSEASATASLVGEGVQAGSTVVQGGAIYKRQTALSREIDAQADATSASSAADAAQARVDDAISRMRETLNDRKLKMDIIAGFAQAIEQLDDELVDRIRG